MSVNIQRVVCGALEENFYIVRAEGRDDCVAIDPGDEYPRLRRALGDMKVGAILLTHAHFDHLMAAGEMAEAYGAPVYVAEADAEMLNDPTINGAINTIGLRERTWHEVTAQYYGESVSACGLDFTVLPTPGHSRGSVCLYLEDEGILFSGDTLFQAGYGRLDLHGSDMGAMIKSLKRLFALPPGVRVYPGHGGDTTIGAERARYRL